MTLKKYKIITFQELEERDFDKKYISNYKLVCDKCLRCGNYFEYSNVKKFLRNRVGKNKKYWKTCQKCWHLINTVEDKNWIEKNRQSQLIAQNKPEQKAKNALGVSKSWTDKRKKEASRYLKNRWQNDLEFADKAIKNLEWTNGSDSKLFNTIINKSFGSGGLKGLYKNINYDSALELSFIMWCENNNISIVRFNLNSIEYKDENGKIRNYIPDFITQNSTIVEIKGLGLYNKINYNRNILKIEAAKQHNLDYCIIFSDDNRLKKNYNIARRWHHENKIKKDNSV